MLIDFLWKNINRININYSTFADKALVAKIEKSLILYFIRDTFFQHDCEQLHCFHKDAPEKCATKYYPVAQGTYCGVSKVQRYSAVTKHLKKFSSSNEKFHT